MKNEVKVEARVVQPGWLLVHFSGPLPQAYEQYHWLDQALHDWLSQHPRHILQRVLPIENAGQTVGLNAWFLVPSLPSQEFSFNVDKEVTAAHSQEYLEAVMAAVVDFMQFGVRHTKFVGVVNCRGIATIVPKEGNRGLMMPLHRFESLIGSHLHPELHRWLKSPTTTLFIMSLPDDFEPPETLD
ncbi:MAG: hypothetical protein ACKVP0_18905 [Pirellulaceae bacterium]